MSQLSGTNYVPSSKRDKPQSASYTGFQGIDTTRGIEALEIPEKQPFTKLVNGFCDWRGYACNNPPIERLIREDYNVTEIIHYARGRVAFASSTQGGTSIIGDTDKRLVDVYPPDGIVSSCVFNRRAVFFCRDFDSISFNGYDFKNIHEQSANPVRAEFGVTIQRRLAVAGSRLSPTTVYISRVDDETFMPADEPVENEQVTRAGFIDIGNLLSTADEITGLGVFENSKLCIFTRDQVILYTIDSDITNWQIDERSGLQEGCISHRTIKNAGSDLLFCSRSGVYSLRRSAANGLSFFPIPLSVRIQELYLQLVDLVADKEKISACYDQDLGHYHIFFPISGARTFRLTIAMFPSQTEGQASQGFWSVSDYMKFQCADYLGGDLVFGSRDGVFIQRSRFTEGARGETTIETPILWMGDSDTFKWSKGFSLQLDGSGEVVVEAFDETGRELSSFTVYTGETLDGDFFDVPAIRQYKQIFEHQFRGVRFAFRVKSRTEVRLYGFTVHLKGAV